MQGSDKIGRFHNSFFSLNYVTGEFTGFLMAENSY